MINGSFAQKYGKIGEPGVGGELEVTSIGGNIEVKMQLESWGGRLCRWVKDMVSFPLPGRRNTISGEALTRVKVDLLKDETLDTKTQGLILKKIHRLEKQNIPLRIKHLRAMASLTQPATPSLVRAFTSRFK